MQPGRTIFGFSLEEWAAIATVVNGITVVVLVFINILFLRSTNKQVKASIAQADEGRLQADAATESLKLLKAQSDQATAQELIRTLAILHGIQAEVMFWQPVVKDQF